MIGISQLTYAQYLCVASIVLFIPAIAAVAEEKTVSFDALGIEYAQQVQPLLKKFCNDCHSTKEKEGELDLPSYDGEVCCTKGHTKVPPDQPTARVMGTQSIWDMSDYWSLDGGPTIDSM